MSNGLSNKKGVNDFAEKKHLSAIQAFFLYTWYKKSWLIWLWVWLLIPFSWLYRCLSVFYASRQKKRSQKLSVPVVVIGNISVGGTGKTPVIIALATALRQQGIAVGIVSRGHGSAAPQYPYHVNAGSDVVSAGDEPLLIAKATQCPVMIDKNRVAAGQALLALFPETQIILSDDGLQHYALERDVEVIVIDGKRGLGNHLCLPAGPLREPAMRLASADWILLNQSQAANVEKNAEQNVDTKNNDDDEQQTEDQSFQTMTIKPVAWKNIATGDESPLQPVPWMDGRVDGVDNSRKDEIVAVAGIGNPQRFFDTLSALDINFDHYSFDDHYSFTDNDFSSWKDSVVLMTEKDAVKCQQFAESHWWSLQVEAVLPTAIIGHVSSLVHPSSSISLT